MWKRWLAALLQQPDGALALRDPAAGTLVLAALAKRMEEVGLRLRPDKTKIVYCKDSLMASMKIVQ